MSDAAAVCGRGRRIGVAASTAVPLPLAGGRRRRSRSLAPAAAAAVCSACCSLASALGARAGRPAPRRRHVDRRRGSRSSATRCRRRRASGSTCASAGTGSRPGRAARRGRASARALAGDRVLRGRPPRPVPAEAREPRSRCATSRRGSPSTPLTGMRPPVASDADRQRRAPHACSTAPRRSRPTVARSSPASCSATTASSRSEVVDDFRGAGLTHLLVVSGQNVAFVLALAAPLLRRLSRRRATGGRASWCSALFGIDHALGAVGAARRGDGGGRAVIAAASGRPSTAIRVLALAVTGVVLVDPLLVHAPASCCRSARHRGHRAARPADRAPTVPGPGGWRPPSRCRSRRSSRVAPVLVPRSARAARRRCRPTSLAVPVAGPVMMWGMARRAVGRLRAGVGGRAPPRAHPRAHLGVWPPVAARARPPAAACRASARSRWRARRGRRRRGSCRAGRRARAPVGVASWRSSCSAMLAPRGASRAALGRPRSRRAHACGRRAAATVVELDGASTATLLAGLRRGGHRRIDVVLLGRRSARPRRSPRVGAPPRRHAGGRRRTSRVRRYPLAPPAHELRAGPLVVTSRVAAAEDCASRWHVGPPGRLARPLASRAVRLALGPRTYDLSHRALVMGILNRTPDSFYDQGELLGLRRLPAPGRAARRRGRRHPRRRRREGRPRARGRPSRRSSSGWCRPSRRCTQRFDLPHLGRHVAGVGGGGARTSVGAVDRQRHQRLRRPRLPARSRPRRARRSSPRTSGCSPASPTPSRTTTTSSATSPRSCSSAPRGPRPPAIAAERIVLDAGLDLGKTWQQSLVLLRALRRAGRLGYPLLLSASNKTFLGKLLDLEIDRAARARRMAATALGVIGGCRIVRAHDVRGTRRVCDALAAVLEHARARAWREAVPPSCSSRASDPVLVGDAVRDAVDDALVGDADRRSASRTSRPGDDDELAAASSTRPARRRSSPTGGS